MSFTIPSGWGVQPDDDEGPWERKLYRCGDLRVPEQPEHGTRVVAKPARRTPDRGYPRGAARLFLAQCWCGRVCAEVDPELVKAGNTVVCSYPRCAEIAAMSPAKRVKFRPRNGSLNRSHTAVPVVETGIDTPHTPPSPSVRGNPAGEHAGSGRSVGAGLGARGLSRPPTPGAQHP